jgi:hypothetical protein
VAVGSVMLVILALIPFAITSALFDALGVPERRVFPISETGNPPANNHVDLHVAIVSYDIAQQVATLRVSGHQTCQPACGWSDRVLFFSFPQQDAGAAGLPPSANVTLPPTSTEVTQTIQLPARGLPIRYPFDTHTLLLGVAVQRVQPDGTQQSLTPAEAAGQLFITLEADLPGMVMASPVSVDPGNILTQDNQYQVLYLRLLDFYRPPYLWVLTILLVTLAAASAAYAVVMRPLPELAVSSGAIILGLWGIRAVLTAGGPAIVTAVDLALSAVILFILGTMGARTLWFLYKRSEVDLLRHRHRK